MIELRIKCGDTTAPLWINHESIIALHRRDLGCVVEMRGQFTYEVVETPEEIIALSRAARLGCAPGEFEDSKRTVVLHLDDKIVPADISKIYQALKSLTGIKLIEEIAEH